MIGSETMLRLWVLPVLLGAALQLPAAADPAISVVRSADGTDLLVAQEGDPQAPSILMIHGFAQSYLSFRRQFGSGLAKHYHLVAFDLRGHGGSAKPSDPAAYSDIARSADDIAAVIAATGLTRPVIVAWSYGGVVVGDYVRKYCTSNISGVVFVGTLGGLVAPIVGAPPAKASPLVAALKQASTAARSFDLARNIAGGETIASAYKAPKMSAEDLRILFATEIMLPAYVRRAMTRRPYDNTDLVSTFTSIPTLFVRGEFEVGMGEPELAVLATKLPAMKLSRYAGAGHLTFFVNAPRFNAELASFAASAFARSVDPAAAIPRPTMPMSLAQFRAFRDLEFAARDTNHNGQLDPEEIRVAAGGVLSSEELASGMRLNCGMDVPACPLDQFRKHGDDEFKHVDRNDDGIVTWEEVKAAGGFHAKNP